MSHCGPTGKTTIQLRQDVASSEQFFGGEPGEWPKSPWQGPCVPSGASHKKTWTPRASQAARVQKTKSKVGAEIIVFRQWCCERGPQKTNFAR
jgi:hypothetical protein